ncbi:MAG: zinc dependent phospholipase C family protein, partial [Candidatus Bathyarchaeia archaeon]
MPRFGTHDWIALHAYSWLPENESWWILENMDDYLLGTELPDNGGHPQGIGDTTLHHVYYDSSEELVDNSSAVRALVEYNLAMAFLNVGNYSAAALHAGIMSHYIVDVGVFGHVMGSGTDWGAETHHSDYEDRVESRTDEYPGDTFTSYLSYDGALSELDAYNATLQIAYDTTFDTDGSLTCVWMDANYAWSNQTFVDRAGESMNLCVNVLADVLHTLNVRADPDVTIANFKTLFAHRNVTMIHPSFSQSKPLGVKAAMVSDWTASEYIYVKLSNVTEGLDTDTRFVNQTTGRALGASGTGIITFGGPDVNLVVYYA